MAGKGTSEGGRDRARHRATIEAMIALYCRGVHHHHAGLCEECQGLLAYAHERLERCVFGAKKPVCAMCPVHCYKPEMRARIKAVMRYAGPRLLFHRPRLVLFHLLARLRSKRWIAEWKERLAQD